jgi:L-arabinose isomerase
MDAWLEHGGTHHMVLNLGAHADRWRTFARLAGIECVQV